MAFKDKVFGFFIWIRRVFYFRFKVWYKTSLSITEFVELPYYIVLKDVYYALRIQYAINIIVRVLLISMGISYLETIADCILFDPQTLRRLVVTSEYTNDLFNLVFLVLIDIKVVFSRVFSFVLVRWAAATTIATLFFFFKVLRVISCP